jgi:outer membrane receptor for ferrienterochelin and colicins
MRNYILFSFVLSLLANTAISQHTDANIFGDVQSGGEHIPFATIYIEGTTIGTTTDATGHYMMIDLPPGKAVIVAQSVGYVTAKKEVLIEQNKTLEVNFVLEEQVMSLEEIVITGTKTFKRSTETPVIVNVLDSKNIGAIQACNISEGLKFQPGLRIETDCQTCNYTQLRMNGLGGGYSQILINGRPIFSPLIGLYGMEQIPANMVDRIEVVRGGGSALYGSSAIGGTVNIITNIPNTTDYSLSFTTHSINSKATDNILNGNVTMVSAKRNAGASLFANYRSREWYDHEGITLNPDGSQTAEKDNYSELPALKNNSFGGTVFYRPAPNQKLELNFTSLSEYRYGGEMINKEAYLAQQSEERSYNILMGGIDYQINFNQDNSSFIAYFAGQNTTRDHYTGLYPVREEYNSDSAFNDALMTHLEDPPYGFTDNSTFQGGVN